MRSEFQSLERISWPGTFLCILCMGVCSISSADLIEERELRLCNTLDIRRDKELVTVRVEDLGVSRETALKIRDVEVIDTDGRQLPCQVDNFSQFAGLSSEVALEVDLKPYEARGLVIRFYDATLPSRENVCSVKLDEDKVEVCTPEFTAPVRHARGNGLWVEQPRIILSGKKRDDAEFAELMADALHSSFDDKPSAKMDIAKSIPKADLEPPMGKGGLPFCVQGFSGFSPQAELHAWGGPLRAVVSLIDRSAPWANLADGRGVARQTIWFPRSGKRFFMDLQATLDDGSKGGGLNIGVCRVNSSSYAWTMEMGQDGKPPDIVPIRTTLHNTRQPPLFIEEKPFFNHAWGQLVAAKQQGWVAVTLDRYGGRLGTTRNWSTGRTLLNNVFLYNDPGPYGDSFGFIASFREAPAGFKTHIRAVAHFGGKDDPPVVMYPIHECFNANPVVLPSDEQALPAPEPARLGELAREKNVLIVVPDALLPDRTGLWNELAARLGGVWLASSRVLKFFNTDHNEIPPADLLTVMVGEPGNNLLLDQWNRSRGFFSAYPLGKDKHAVALFEQAGPTGAVLAIAGNSDKATTAAVESLLKSLGPAAKKPPVTLANYEWGDRMPWPWSGLKDHQGAFKAPSYRNGHAEFLLLMRSSVPLANVRLETPQGAIVRHVPWNFGGGMVPCHDAAFPGIPAQIPENGYLGLWISLKIPADSKPGIRHDTARLVYEGGARDISLETDVLSPVLADRYALGFFPMQLDMDGLRFYYDISDDDSYYKMLPDFIRDAREFAANAFPVNAPKIVKGSDGQISLDTTLFEKDLAAVQDAGRIDQLFMYSLHGAVNFDNWETATALVRALLREKGLENKMASFYNDEIGDFEGWLGYADIFAQCGVKMTCAINGYGVHNKHLGVGTMTFWVPLYNLYLNNDKDPKNFTTSFRDARHAAGEQIWPYVCGPGPYAWSPRPRSQGRFLVMDTFLKGADGLSYYGGMAWSHVFPGGLRNKKKADFFNTDCTFVTLLYPNIARKRLMPSLRVAAMRQGFEDVTAIEAVRRLAREKGRLDAVDAEIRSEFGKIDMNAASAMFDNYRQILDKLYRDVAAP